MVLSTSTTSYLISASYENNSFKDVSHLSESRLHNPTRRNPLHNQALNRMPVEVNWVYPLNLSAVHPNSSGLAKLALSDLLGYSACWTTLDWNKPCIDRTRCKEAKENERQTGGGTLGGKTQARNPSGETQASVIMDNTPKPMRTNQIKAFSILDRMYLPHSIIQAYKILT